jgi:phospholipid/cholesterol/gamma-HCH transport system ATP-binding protein
MVPVIELDNVSLSFADKHILAGASLAIQQGETLTIIGGSGKGKTVLLKVILGVLKPDAGRVLFKGQDIGPMSDQELSKVRSRMGMLFQGAALFDSLSVRENVAYPLREHFHHDEVDITRIVAEKLRLVGLPGIEEMMPSELSGGMKKRVGLARAIATNPDLLLYDEPTTGLDPANTKRICGLIKSLQQKLGVTSVVVTHDMEAAFSVTDRIAMIYSGAFGFVGTKEEACSSQEPFVQHFIRGEMETADG